MMIDIIEKKKRNQELSIQEIEYVIDGYVKGSIPDYQMTALLMAICFNGLGKAETTNFTKAMIESGEIIDLSTISGIKADKHSTGGVGDKVSLVLAPMVVAAGLKVAKMSGRGLGHTGGTLDKLESIDGFKIEISKEDFIKQVQEIGIAIIGQSANLVPADKKIYALRDVSATVDNIQLIAASIMSKKLACGSDIILLDVKYGSGAFMKDKESAILLANTMIDIGKSFNKPTSAIISSMEQPLGKAIGNSLEIKEVIECLQGCGPSDVIELCLLAGSQMLYQANIVNTIQEGKSKLEQTIIDGSAFDKFKEMVLWQGGNIELLDNPSLFTETKYVVDILSMQAGYISNIAADTIGSICMKLGGGRSKKDDDIDHSVGIILENKVGNKVAKNDILCRVHTREKLDNEFITRIRDVFTIKQDKIEKPILIEAIVE